MQTKQLYYDDIDLLEFSAKVLEINEVKDEYHVMLDQTAFYPEGGGMNCDKGFIDGIEIINVIKKNDEIYHILKTKPTKTEILCQVDPYVRLTNIQIHDAQHLLTGFFEKEYELFTVSHHVHGDYCDLVLEGSGELTLEVMQEIEEKSNQLILEDRKIDIMLITKNDLAKFGLEDNPKYTDPIRLTNIDSLDDYNACGCLHFASVGKIQAVKCLGFEKVGKQYKILFTAGLKMLKLFAGYNDIIKDLKIITKGNEDTMISKVEELVTKNISLSKELNETKEQYYATKLDSLVEDGIVVYNGADNSFDEIKILANVIINSPNKVHGLLQTRKDDKYQFILVKQKGNDYSLEDLFAKLKSDLNVQGGGRGLSINGQSPVDLTKEIKKYL